MTKQHSPHIVIGIPTFKRPIGLRRLLVSLAKLEGEVVPHILVVDNEGPNGQGLKAVAEVVAEGYPWPITAVPEPERGISQARNTLLEVGFGKLSADFLAMVDDDTWVEPQWLKAMLEMQAQTAADVVGGNIKPDFAGPRPRWSYGLRAYWDNNYLKHGKVEGIYTTTAVLISKTVYAHKLVFDPQYSLTGGGDAHFFQRCRKLGLSFACNLNAVSYEVFESDRANIRWLVQREFRLGRGAMEFMMNEKIDFKKIIKEFARITVALSFGLFGVLFFILWPAKWMFSVAQLARQFGKIAYFFDIKINEYKKVYGQ